MIKSRTIWLWLVVLMLGLSACSAPQPASPAAVQEPAAAEPAEPEAPAEATAEPAATDPPVEEAPAAQIEEATAEPAEEATAAPVEEMAASAEPTVLRQGAFRDRDAQHQGSGTAMLIQNGDELQLHLADFASSDGPDLFVWLVENPDTLDADDLGATLDLGLLQALTGDQEYVIPAGTDLSAYQGVIIYCREFHFVFSTAPFSN